MDNMARVLNTQVLVTPRELHETLPVPVADATFVTESRRAVEAVLTGADKRLLLVMGPCSIHSPEEALEYGRRLQVIAPTCPGLLIVMRLYFEKPRTRAGWKGLIYDPFLDGSDAILEGLRRARTLMLGLTAMRVPIACEFLDVITPQYLADLVCWGAIGARTTESQIHRHLASGLPMAVGFKNVTSGNWSKAIDGVLAAADPHSFIGASYDGRMAHIETLGNPACHVVLRGGDDRPNYSVRDIQELSVALLREKVHTRVMVDCSHGNSGKNHLRQVLVALYTRRLQLNGYCVGALMIESNLRAGRQELTLGQPLQWGLSITDACIGWDSSAALLDVLQVMALAPAGSFELGEVRTRMRHLDDLMCALLADGTWVGPDATVWSCLPERYFLCLDAEIHVVCSRVCPERVEMLSMLVSQRLMLAEAHARLLFASRAFACMHKLTDLGTLVETEMADDARLEPILALSKRVQVAALERIVQEQRVGFVASNGSADIIRATFRGALTAFESEDALRSAHDVHFAIRAANGTVAKHHHGQIDAWTLVENK